MRLRRKPGLMPEKCLSAFAALVTVIAVSCGGDPDLLAVENRTGGPVSIEIIEVPNDRPLESGSTRTAAVPADTMYQTELVEITGETSARIRVAGPDGVTLCEHVATESEPAPRLIVLVGGCSVETGVP